MAASRRSSDPTPADPALARRWASPEGAARLRSALEALRRRRPLDQTGGLDRHAGRWDLRGIRLARPEPAERLAFDRYEVELLAPPPLELRKAALEKLDFSHSALPGLHEARHGGDV